MCGLHGAQSASLIMPGFDLLMAETGSMLARDGMSKKVFGRICK